MQCTELIAIDKDIASDYLHRVGKVTDKLRFCRTLSSGSVTWLARPIAFICSCTWGSIRQRNNIRVVNVARKKWDNCEGKLFTRFIRSSRNCFPFSLQLLASPSPLPLDGSSLPGWRLYDQLIGQQFDSEPPFFLPFGIQLVAVQFILD